MPLPSFLKPKDKKPAPRRAAAAAAGDDAGPVQQARTRARRRLIGAVVLLAVGIVGFPLIFETQPRPVAVDIPIEAPPHKGEVATTVTKPAASRAPAPAVVTEVPAEVIEEPAPKPAPPVASVPPPAPKPVVVASAPTPKPAPAAKTEDSARAKALLEDTAKAPGRFVVQVGAFSDGNALRDTRQKVEKLGLKTYTQAVETDAGKRTRVRVGPFATREEAESAGAKLKAAGLPAAILTL